MASKSKKQGNRPSTADLFHFAQRAIEKLDFKEALKNAKVCFRQDPTHENRQILERSWLGRGLQLARAGLTTEGRAAAQELLAMGVSQPDVRQGLPELLLAVGLYDKAVASGTISATEQAADPSVLARAADRAVADPASAPASLAGPGPWGNLGEGAERVRLALDALQAGDEAAALLILGEVPRNSPFAEWKLFVRGLAAYYRHDDATMRANWDRLDSSRFAARLAAPLRRLADPSADHGLGHGDPDGYREAIRVLEADLLGGPAVWYFESLQKSLSEDRWREAVQGVRRWKKDFQVAMPDLARRIDRLFYDTAVRKHNMQLLSALLAGGNGQSGVDPPSWDPRWFRARAMISEVDGESDGLMTEGYWNAYLEDLATLPDFKPEERTLAQAMVWEHLGNHWADEADEDEDDRCDCEDCRREREERGLDPNPTLALRSKAIECLKKAIELAPTYAVAYRELADCYDDWDQADAAAETNRRLLENVPDDFDAVEFLFLHHLKRDEAVPARDYALRARRLKPASERVLDMVVSGHYLSARAFALLGQFDEARAELAAAAAAGTSTDFNAYDLTVRRAMVEFKAGQPDAARRLVDQAVADGQKSADVYLALAIMSVRFEVPFELDDPHQQFWHRWLTSLKKRESRAAGAMSRRMLGFLTETGLPAGKLSFLKEYLERVVAYVGGCTRIRWQADDLLHACRFLTRVLEERQFREVRRPLEKLLDAGRKKFPAEPEFHSTRGTLEMERGPGRCNRRLARECFEMAIKSAATSTRPNVKEIMQQANTALGYLGADSPMLPGGSRRRFRPDRTTGQDWAGMPDFAGGVPPFEEMMEMVARMAARMGLDPREMLDDLPLGAAGGPGRNSAKRRK
jgi:tetratricopeptide (TPR) repeat protein